MAGRTLSEAEFNRIKDQVYAHLPANLSEADFNRLAPSVLAGALAEAEQLPAVPEGSAAARVVSNAWKYLNPVSMVTGLYESVKSPEAVAQTLENIVQQQGAQFGKAAEAGRQGRYAEMVGHGVAGALPLVGPAAAAAGQQIAQGDIAGGLGAGAGLVGSVLAPSAVKAGVAQVPRLNPAALAEAAASRVASVMAPAGRSKANIRMGNTAAEVAPELLNEPDLVRAWSREGLHANVTAAFEDAKAGLDAAHDARLSARTFETQPLIDALLEKRRRLSAEAVEASRYPPTGRGTRITATQEAVGFGPAEHVGAQPLGESVVPRPNAPRVAQIDQAIAELKQLGPVARYEPLRVMRAAYDLPAEVTYNPSVTADFLQQQGGARGAADVTGVLREFLAGHEPATATANARFSLLKSAQDVMAATAEQERVRPAVGRRIMQSFVGSVSGGAVAGLPGVAIGAMVGPVIDAAMSAGVTTKLQTARLLQELATAVRTNNPRAAASVGARLRRRVPQLGPLLAAPGALPAAATARGSGTQE